MLYLLALVAITWLLFLLTGIVYQRLGLRRDMAQFPPPGRLVNVGVHRLHVFEMGQGTPPVVLESGISASSVNWRRVQTAIAEFTQVLAYDRPGFGWSDAARTVRTANQVVEELHELLQAANVPRPCILVGHSFGGLAARLYAARYPRDVVGLVLVDPLRPEEWWPLTPLQKRMLWGGAFLSRWGALLAHLGVVRFTLTRFARGSRFLPRLIGRMASTGAGLSTMERIVGEIRKMPEELWPAIIAHWCDPKSFSGMSRHLAELPQSVSCMIDAPPLDVPVTLITAGRNPPFPPDEAERISSRAEHVVARESGHWIHLDEPEVVIEAVREMVMQLREAARSPRGT